MLKLEVEIITSGGEGDPASIYIHMNEATCGPIDVLAEHLDELVGLLSAAAELLHACKFMWRQAIMEGRGCSGDPNEAEYDRAKAAIDVAEAKGGAE